MSRTERKPSRLRGLLLFVLGVLVGANATYYLMTRSGPYMRAPAPAPVHAPESVGNALPADDTTSPDDMAPALPAPVPRMPDTGTGNLLIPVQGILASQLRDTFTDARSAGRSHDAIDIMAPTGTPVLAVADGRVEKLFDSRLGGLTLYEFSSDGTLAYYYAHLQRYADGIAEQQAIQRGQVIGYVGATGNASPDAPHLHFAVFVLAPEKQWWKGEAVNPYPRLTASPIR